jgi:DNA-binding response OmpR family regulator
MPGKSTILVVDDDQDIVKLLKITFQNLGYEVIPAYNGYEALGAAIIENPDLIILDVMLPQINGYEISRLLKEDIEKGHFKKDIPIVILTARKVGSDQEDEVLRAWAKADEYIFKPIDITHMTELAKKLMNKS